MGMVHRILGNMKNTIHQRPLIRGMLIYSITWPVGSLIQQKLESDEINFCRVVKFSLYGSLYVAPSLFGWMKLSCLIWPKTTLFSTVTKAYVEQITYGPFSILSFLFIMSLLEGGSFKDGQKEICEKFFPTWKISVIIWPLIQTINYSCIPEKNRVPFIGLCSLLWTIFLAFVKYEFVKGSDKRG